MAWIESHQSLLNHPKTRKLSRALDVSVPTAIGHLHALWWWALDYAQDGSLGRYEDADIADGAMWEGDAETFVRALQECEFLQSDEDGNLHIHDWFEYAGKLIERRKEDAARKRSGRRPPVPPGSGSVPNKDVQRMSDGCPEDVQRMSDVTAQHSTAPNRTEENLTEPLEASSKQHLENAQVHAREEDLLPAAVPPIPLESNRLTEDERREVSEVGQLLEVDVGVATVKRAILQVIRHCPIADPVMVATGYGSFCRDNGHWPRDPIAGFQQQMELKSGPDWKRYHRKTKAALPDLGRTETWEPGEAFREANRRSKERMAARLAAEAEERARHAAS